MHAAWPGVAQPKSNLHRGVLGGRAHTSDNASQTTSRQGGMATQRGWSSPWTVVAHQRRLTHYIKNTNKRYKLETRLPKGISYLLEGDAPAYEYTCLTQERDKQRRVLTEHISLHLIPETHIVWLIKGSHAPYHPPHFTATCETSLFHTHLFF
jgi:hypothetical protein